MFLEEIKILVSVFKEINQIKSWFKIFQNKKRKKLIIVVKLSNFKLDYMVLNDFFSPIFILENIVNK